MDSQPRQVTVHYFLINQRPSDGLSCFIDGYAVVGLLVWCGGLPPGTFRLKVLEGNGLRLDLWKSYLADFSLKAKARRVLGLVDLGLLLV
jgi:hypothetical protein